MKALLTETAERATRYLEGIADRRVAPLPLTAVAALSGARIGVLTPIGAPHPTGVGRQSG